LPFGTLRSALAMLSCAFKTRFDTVTPAGKSAAAAPWRQRHRYRLREDTQSTGPTALPSWPRRIDRAINCASRVTPLEK
jgi:hypothetical protein